MMAPNRPLADLGWSRGNEHDVEKMVRATMDQTDRAAAALVELTRKPLTRKNRELILSHAVNLQVIITTLMTACWMVGTAPAVDDEQQR